MFLAPDINTYLLTYLLSSRELQQSHTTYLHSLFMLLLPVLPEGYSDFPVFLAVLVRCTL